ncbi:MAG TPA: 1-acyl-sn-glycerol-3-phosphate acyltransferase [Firmicutes bacterium]|jgi:1-acyl-sn-glycerol-3-phosphate acyltransferase|nr:1-acyl-sn-glycerol-3-phosphate acyltransferase [Bacillota bacterium]
MLYKVLRWVFIVFFKIFYDVQIYGADNIPSSGPYIICSNHTSWFDPPLIGCVFSKNKLCFMAKEELFRVFILGYIIKRIYAFPVKRNTADRAAIRRALQILDQGDILALFPEGTRIRTKELGKPHHGAALIALKSKKPIIPVFIKWPPHIFMPVKVGIGSLIFFEEEGKIKSKILEKASQKIMEELKKAAANIGEA